MELKEWLDAHNINHRIGKDVLYVKGWGRALIQEMGDRDHIFKQTKDGDVVFNCMEGYEFLKGDDIYYVVFPFGNRWYYIDIRDEKGQFKILRYVGDGPQSEIEYAYYPLGIHTGYELLNGSGSMEDWSNKSRFLGFKGLGTCELNTFAASLELQNTATAKDMRYCFGYSLVMEIGEEHVEAKIYANTQQGFNNILRIQKAINVDREDGYINYVNVLNLAKGNCLVFGKWSAQWMVEHEDMLTEFIKAFEGWVYYQVDLSEYAADRFDKKTLENTKAFFDNFYIEPHTYKHNIMPVLIQDVYYLDEDNYKNKIILNKVDIGAAHELSYKQYMKTLDEMYDEFNALFSEKYGDDVFEDMCNSTVEIMENADAKYDLSENYAPKYDMTEKEQLMYGTVHNMFNELIEEGFNKLVPKGQEEVYRKQIEYEKYVIESTDNIDYFMITLDEVRYAREQGIMVGIGRGSAGGSLLLYLLGITKIDSIKWGLIFERFLLPERAGLEADQVSKIEADVKSTEYIELTLENGLTYKFDKDARFRVMRDGELMDVYADELNEGDDIQFDNRDLLFTLNEIENESNENNK